MRLLADEVAGRLDHLRHARHAANEHELINVFLVELRVRDTVFNRLDRPLEEIIGELLELRARQLFLNVFRPARVCRDERQIDFVFLRTGERDLRFLRFFLDPLDRVRMLGQIDAAVFPKFADDPIHHLRVPIVTAEVRVAVGRLYFKDAVTDFENGDVERAAAQIVDRDLLVFLFVEPVRKRGCGRFVDDAQNFETGNFARVFGRVALRDVEIRRDRDDRLRNFFAELRFRVGLHFGQNHRRDFRRRESLLLPVHFHLHVRVAVRRFHDFVGNAMFFFVDLVKLPAHETFD